MLNIFNIFKKNIVVKTGFFSILVFLGSFNITHAMFDIVLGWVGELMLSISSYVLYFAGSLFNYTLVYTLDFKKLVESTGMVNIGWEVIRDFSNMIFIFLLLFLSIGTILGRSDYNIKNSIKNIIIAALLINFSLFFTNIIIDTSNVVAVGFYNATLGTSTTDDGKAIIGEDAYDKGISGIFSQNLKLESIYREDGLKVKGGESIQKNIFTIALFGSIFLLITAFVFFAAAFLFIIRTVTLMFVMMLSPIAFIGMVLPGTKSYASKWWNTLFKQAFFAPIYLMFIYITAKGINSDAFQTTLAEAGNKGFTDAFTGGGAILVVFNFMLIISFMLGSLISASSLGARGSSGMISLGKGLQKWGQGRIGASTFGAGGRLGRSTIGAAADWGAKKLENSNMSGTWGGKLGLKGLRNVADSSFDARNTEIGKVATGAIPGGLGTGIKGGYKTKVDEKKKEQIKYAQSLKGDITDSEGNTISRTEVYGQKLKDKTENRGRVSSIFTTVVGDHGGDAATASSLIKETTLKRELQELKDSLKSENNGTLKEARKQLRQLQNKQKTIKRKSVLSELTDIDNRTDNIKQLEDDIKEKIEEKKKEYEKAKDSNKDKK
ncbi:MAG: hypothetical protein KAS02_01410 [Candidatus Pacebacteria bacterium]|nr:hypothetical protein [Candidatus Paceibacterota bacterium]